LRRIAGLRILLVDDMDEVGSALKSFLEFAGATIPTACSAASALQVVAENELDLIVSEIAMPGLNGYAFMREVRDHPGHRTLPSGACDAIGFLVPYQQASFN
jgi:two-component system CheB/CheR fusion protein